MEEAADDNLCAVLSVRKKLTATIVMGSDAAYEARVKRCAKPGEDPVSVNAKYADKFKYALRFYVDEDVPFIRRHDLTPPLLRINWPFLVQL